MVLDIGGVPNVLFDQSRQDNVGMYKTISDSRTWSAEGYEFITQFPDVDDMNHNDEGFLLSGDDNVFCMMAVRLPQGATIIDAVVDGTAATVDKWTLFRSPFSEVPSISVKIVDGSLDEVKKVNYVVNNDVETYFFFVRLYTGEQINHAIIHYVE